MSTPPAPPPPESAKPAPQPKPYLHTRSAHNVKLWIDQAIKDGRLKDCWNLGIDKVVERQSEDGKAVEDDSENDFYFIPTCAHHSFVSDFAHTTEEIQLHILRHNLSNDPVSCPKDCTYYESRRWASTRSVIGRGLKAMLFVPGELWKAFKELTWPQATVVGVVALIIILWKSPQWVPLLVSLAKAIWGKG